MLVFWFNTRMNIDAYRRARLQELIDNSEAKGNVAEFSRLHDEVVSATRLRQLLNPNYRDGEGFKEGAARKLEKVLKLAERYLDQGFERAVAGKHISAPADYPIYNPNSSLFDKSPPPGRSRIINEPIESNVGNKLDLRVGRPVAIVGEVQGGPDGYISIDDYPVGHGHAHLPEVRSRDSSAYGLRVRGDSMRPRIKSGEYIVVEPNSEAQPGDDVVVKFLDGSTVVKELLWIRDGDVCLGSINNGIAPMTIPLQKVEYIHRVAAIMPRGSAIGLEG